MGVWPQAVLHLTIEKETAGEKNLSEVLWEQWPVANTEGQWEASGVELVLVE